MAQSKSKAKDKPTTKATKKSAKKTTDTTQVVMPEVIPSGDSVVNEQLSFLIASDIAQHEAQPDGQAAPSQKRGRKKTESAKKNDSATDSGLSKEADPELSDVGKLSKKTRKKDNQIVIPVHVSNTISSSQVVSGVFEKFRIKGGQKVPPPRKKIVLDTERMNLGTIDQFTEFDRAVLEAVFAQLSVGNTIMTPAMIFRSMTSKDSGVNVSDDILLEVNRSIEKCMYGSVTIPSVDKRSGKVVTLDSNILSIIRASYNIMGVPTQAYEVQNMPMLYRYCISIGALTCSPIEMNAIPGMSMTKRSVAIMNFLQRVVTPRVFDTIGNCVIVDGGRDASDNTPIPGGHWLSPEFVSYEELYHTVTSLDNCKQTRYLEGKTKGTVERILNFWVQSGYIRRWETVKQPNAKGKVIGVNIFFHPVDSKAFSILEAPSPPPMLDS